MKKIGLIVIALYFLALPIYGFASQSSTTSVSLADKYAGRFLLQVQSYGRAWYINPTDRNRYYLGADATTTITNLGMGISNKDLQKIPTKKGIKADQKLVNRLKGKILLQVQDKGQAWYVNPLDGLRYQLSDASTTLNLAGKFSQGVTDAQLRQIPMNQKQLTFDSAFNDIAYAALDTTQGNYTANYLGDQILPLASMTKLMTAMVFYDTNPDWQKQITVTQAQLDYPKYYAGDDETSEVGLKAGDQVKIEDLWTAMLVASSNQSAAILAEASGLSKADFVNQMNAKAKELGLTKTNFVDASGLDCNNISTPKEYAKVAQSAFSNPKIATTTRITAYDIQAVSASGTNRTIPVVNRNYSLLAFQPEASKTGYLIEAQRNASLIKGGKVIVIMHAHSLPERNKIIKKLLAPQP